MRPCNRSKLVTVCLLILSSLSGTFAQALIHFKGGLHPVTKGEYQYLIDPSYKLTFEEIRIKDFSPSQADVLTLGYVHGAVWIRLELYNELGKELTRLAIENPTLDSVTVYQVDPLGTATPLSDNMLSRRYTFPLFHINQEGPVTIYIQVVSNESVYLPLKFYDVYSVLNKRRSFDVLQAIYVGIMTALFFYNMFIFISIWESSYLYYFIYVGSFTITSIYHSGFLFHIGVPKSYSSGIVFLCIAALSATFFVLEIAKLPDIARRHVFRAKAGLALIALAILILVLFDAAFVASIAVNFYAILACVLILTVAYLSLIAEKYYPITYVLIGWTLFLIAGIIWELKNFGLIEHTNFTHYFVQGASGVEALLLSLALAKRISYANDEKLKAQQREQEYIVRYDKLLKERNKNLSEMISQRTQELEKANTIKDKFFSIIAHDLRGPLNSFQAFFSLYKEHRHRLSEQEVDTMYHQLGKSLSNTIGLTENLLLWARSQMDLERPQPKKINVEEVVRLCIHDLMTSISSKEIDLENKIVPGMYIVADENQLRFVLRNILSNAIKFTPKKGKIEVSCHRYDDDRLCISIKDSGIGMAPDTLANLFKLASKRASRKGTQGEGGSGLGLILCKEFIENNGGEISVTSSDGTGTTVSVYFKKEIP